ncbi:MAG: PAS domain S-box protein [FCB group bacterium]|jgi:PAS domain S-box-containing protein|nr:PAS domain S-box protein [FCB group bacterium]
MKSWIKRYGWALGSVALAYILQTALHLLPFQAPFLPFVAAVAVTALFADLYAALFAMALSLVIVNVQFVDASGDETELIAVRLLLSGLFLGICMLLGWLALVKRRHENARTEAQARFRAAQEVSPEGFCILVPVRDAKGWVTDFRCQYLNLTLQRMLKRENTAGLRLSEALPELRARKGLWRRGLRVLRTGQSQRVEFFFDGRDVQAWFRVWLVKLDDGLAVWVNDTTERKRSDEELRRNEAWLRAFQHTSLDGFLVFKAVREEGRIVDLEYTFSNPAAERMINHGPLVGRRLLEVEPRHAAPGGPFEHYVRVLETGEPHDIEFHYEGDGVRGWFRNMSVKLEDGIAMAFTDITARKTAEDALRQNEAQLRAVVENLAEGLVVSTMDGDLIHWNRAALDMHGFTNLDECRRHLRHFVDIFELSKLDGEVFQPAEWPLARVLRGERLSNMELRIRRLHGDWERIYSYGGALVKEADGTAFLALLTITDITDRKRAEEALQRSNAALAKAGTMAHFGAWQLDIVDPDDFDRSVLRWSDEVYRIFGYEPGGVEVTDALFFRHVYPEDARRVRKVLADAVAEKRPYTIEHRIICADGTERTVLEHAEVAYDDRDRPVRLSGAIQDITERKRAEEELRTFAHRLEDRVAERTAELARSYEALRQSERLAAIGQMATAFSHESRNAIQNSTAAFEMLRRATADQPRLQAYADMGLRALKDLRQIHEDVRDYAAPLRLERSRRPLDTLWRAAWEDLSAEWRERDVRLVEEPDETDVRCDVDPLRMKQVFRNLLENSLAACTDPVEIRLRVTTAELGARPGLCVSVRDNGPGVDPAQAERIFEAFYTTRTKGTGLGLAIVRRIVEAHEGIVELGTEASQGLEVRLLLPIKASPTECIRDDATK